MLDNRSILPEGTLAQVTLKEPLAHVDGQPKTTTHLVTVSFTDTVGVACHLSGFPNQEAYLSEVRSAVTLGEVPYDLFPAAHRLVTFIPWENIAGIRRAMTAGQYAAWFDAAERQSREAAK